MFDLYADIDGEIGFYRYENSGAFIVPEEAKRLRDWLNRYLAWRDAKEK